MKTWDDDFEPPFCPWPECRHHHDPTGWKWRDHGVFERQAEPHRIRRFRCLSCRRTFSTQTFDTTYYLKRPDLQATLFVRSVECPAHRQQARGLGLVHSTVQRQVERLGRHCLLFLHENRPQGPPTEPLVLDGLQTFEFSQWWPFDLNLVVGKISHYIYTFNEAELRRSGSMTDAQREKRERLEEAHGRPDPRATEKAVEELLRSILPERSQVTIHTDEHQAYPRAFQRLREDGHVIDHHSTSSKESRTTSNPLFPVNLADGLIRHSGANHKRETLAFSKRKQAALERHAIFVTWRNFMKVISEKRPNESPTPAMVLGLRKRRLSVEDVLHRRLFPSRTELPEMWRRVYWREVETRQIPNGRRHRLKNAK